MKIDKRTKIRYQADRAIRAIINNRANGTQSPVMRKLAEIDVVSNSHDVVKTKKMWAYGSL